MPLGKVSWSGKTPEEKRIEKIEDRGRYAIHDGEAAIVKQLKKFGTELDGILLPMLKEIGIEPETSAVNAELVRKLRDYAALHLELAQQPTEQALYWQATNRDRVIQSLADKLFANESNAEHAEAAEKLVEKLEMSIDQQFGAKPFNGGMSTRSR